MAWRPWRRAARDQFGFDRVTTREAIEGGGGLATGIWKFVDIGFVDGIVNGLGLFAAWLGSGIKVMQTGYVRPAKTSRQRKRRHVRQMLR